MGRKSVDVKPSQVKKHYLTEVQYKMIMGRIEFLEKELKLEFNNGFYWKNK